MDVEFNYKLRDGRKIFVMANVGRFVEIAHIMTSEDSDAHEISMDSLKNAELVLIEYTASQVAYERAREAV